MPIKHLIDSRCKHKNGLILEENQIAYSCILNQTDIKSNKNKFYIMQLIKIDKGIILFTVYGRIGENGRSSEELFTDSISAIWAFSKQFKLKTGNNFCGKFIKKTGKYYLSEISYEEELKNLPDNKQVIPQSVLAERVQSLIRMLSDLTMITNSLIELEIDTKKLPLGKICQSQLDKAKLILEEVSDLLGKPDNKEELKNKIIELSSQYYTFIPYSCGRKKPPIINESATIAKYKNVLDELYNVVVGVQIINNVKSDENPMDAIYKDINTKIIPLDKNSCMWNEISNYVKNTHGSTHAYKLDIIDILEIEQQGKRDKFLNNGIDNHMLLFHGTPQSCALSIFKKDFYLDPSQLKDVNVQIAGKMFGYGVYFADACTKSFGYTRATMTGNTGVLLLARVALGNVLSKVHADYTLNKNVLNKMNKSSTKGEGKWQPSKVTKIDNLIIPNHPLEKAKTDTDLLYNEYIVYDINQILIQYIVLVKNIS